MDIVELLAAAAAEEADNTGGLVGMEVVVELHAEDTGLKEVDRQGGSVVDLVVAVRVGDIDHSSAWLVQGDVAELLRVTKTS